MEHCATKGFLSFLVLWLVSRKRMAGEEIASELEKKREKKELLSIDENNRHTLIEKGKKSLEVHLEMFIKTFYDIDEMKSCCCNSRYSNK